MEKNVKQIRATAPNARLVGIKPTGYITNANDFNQMNLVEGRVFVKVTNFEYSYLISGINVVTTFTARTADGKRSLFIAAVADLSAGDVEAALSFANSFSA